MQGEQVTNFTYFEQVYPFIQGLRVEMTYLQSFIHFRNNLQVCKGNRPKEVPSIQYLMKKGHNIQLHVFQKKEIKIEEKALIVFAINFDLFKKMKAKRVFIVTFSVNLF